MKTENQIIKKIALHCGTLLGISTIFIFGINYFTDNHLDPPWWNDLSRISTVLIVLFLGIKKFRLANGGFLSIRQAIKTGFFISLMAGTIFASFNFTYSTVIDSDYIIEIREAAMQELITENPEIPQEQVEMIIQIFQPIVMSIFSIVSAVFYGFIGSAIFGFFMKKNKNPE